ncbi:hypothetical protein CYLTODRAFT_494000 [Cylindrobasidium torrendii FP15055 ss-10]|uniref:Uncharacterized protein n=1 Tax=Cylindrobasidium torrendii FP15055 ss-10 TaxID=1314674 RepID=A0A0D7AYN1_9AGAR|nr:hypothetical protein CYLTODRAFT_494000 [Cylindrobasidium torrendii FP15055 ss-10]
MADVQETNMDSHFMQRTDSEVTDESPFGSSLNTPADEEPSPFDNFHQRLFSELDLDAGLDVQKTPRPDGKSSKPPRSMSKVVGRARKFARGLVMGESSISLPNDSSRSSSTSTEESLSSIYAEISSADPSTANFEPPIQPVVEQETLQVGPREMTRVLSRDIAIPDLDVTEPASDLSPEEALDVDSPILRQGLFAASSRLMRPPHDRSISVTAVKDLDVKRLAEEAKSGAEDGLLDTAELLFDEDFISRMINLSLDDIATLIPKALLFLPWYALVGGTILLFPRYLERISFHVGYISSPARGIHRYAHWLECAPAHVLLFLILVGWTVWSTQNLAFAILVLGQTVVAWIDFKAKDHEAVGMDDRQTLYLVAKGMVKDVKLFRREDGQFFIQGANGATTEGNYKAYEGDSDDDCE